MTTLYLRTDEEDALRRVGYPRERRAGPQVIVGLLVDRASFPLRVGCREGSRAETTTLLPIIEELHDAAGTEPLVIVADAGMLLSASDLKALDAAGTGLVVGRHAVVSLRPQGPGRRWHGPCRGIVDKQGPGDLEAHFHWHGDAFTDGQVIDTITPRTGPAGKERNPRLKAEPVWAPQTHPRSWRAVRACSARHLARQSHILDAQVERARDVVNGSRRARTTRFVTIRAGNQVLDEDSIARAQIRGQVGGVILQRGRAAFSP